MVILQPLCMFVVGMNVYINIYTLIIEPEAKRQNRSTVLYLGTTEPTFSIQTEATTLA